MTSLCIDLDASEALRRELYGDPRFTEPDAPAPRLIAQHRATAETIIRTAAIEPSQSA